MLIGFLVLLAFVVCAALIWAACVVSGGVSDE